MQGTPALQRLAPRSCTRQNMRAGKALRKGGGGGGVGRGGHDEIVREEGWQTCSTIWWETVPEDQHQVSGRWVAGGA